MSKLLVICRKLQSTLAMVCILLFTPFISCADNIHVAVASNFKIPMQLLIADFTANSAHTVTLSNASSGKLFAQIVHGAPYDMFFSADQEKVNKLSDLGLIVTHSQYTYAMGAIVLWSNDIINRNSIRASIINNTRSRIAVANPKFAPYGIASIEVLNKLAVVEQTRARWVLGENIGQTYQFVQSENAEMGFIAMSQLVNSPHISSSNIWIVPKRFYSPIKQDVAILLHGNNRSAANAFMAYIKSTQAKEIITQQGYTL